MVTVFVALGCASGCNEFLFWAPKMVPILGTCVGALRTHTLVSNNNGRGYELWLQFWVPFLVTILGTHCIYVFTRFCSVEPFSVYQK